MCQPQEGISHLLQSTRWLLPEQDSLRTCLLCAALTGCLLCCGALLHAAQALNLILLTAGEVRGLRDSLRHAGQQEAGQRSFLALYPCWSHSAGGQQRKGARGRGARVVTGSDCASRRRSHALLLLLLQVRC
jgi:hypothetical protein